MVSSVFSTMNFNEVDLIKTFAAIHTIAVIYINFTETPKDNDFMRRFYKVIEGLAGIITPTAKR